MKPEWQRYQDDAAAYFTSLGLSAEVEARDEGARGIHDIDVLVTGTAFGLEVRWVVECKNWSTNIPKEKVLALQAIVQDTGADRGILLSEVGFQSGAIRVTRNTNITLTSLATLRANTHDALGEEIVTSLHWRWNQIMKRLSKVHKQQKPEHGMFTPSLAVKAPLMFLDSALEDGLNGEFPTIYALDGKGGRLSAKDFDELIAAGTKLIEDAERYADEHLNPNAEQDGAEQPATALESKPEGNENTNQESEVRSQ